jgi:hypothetical protein
VKLRFAGSLTLTHNGTSFILPGGANIQTSAGDCAEFINDAATDASGSNWRCFNYQFANGAPLQTSAPNSQTATYTATDADRGKLVRFSGLASDVTLNLPAAAGRAGFVLYVVNNDANATTGYGVIVDPSGSETIDGVTTRTGYAGTRVTLICDGSGWRTASGNWRYFSGDRSLSSATIPHNLGLAPTRVWVELRCASGEHGYSVGDILASSSSINWDGTARREAMVNYDATNVRINYASPHSILDKASGSGVFLTAASWRLRVYAED